MAEESVLFQVQQGVGWITLNRPKVLNSLNTEMVESIYYKLEEWKHDEQIALVCIIGAGEKGLCAGGDIRELYDHRSEGIEKHAERFFATEYQMDYDVWTFPKPVLAYMNGVVMGGGVGITMGASHRIVTEKTKWAMPEMNIGFFPDVGSSYFLNRLPDAVGKYLALTSSVISAGDLMELGFADYYVKQDDWPQIMQEVSEQKWTKENVQEDLDKLLSTYAQTQYESSLLKKKKEKIDTHFSFNTVEEMVDSLEKASMDKEDWENKTKELLLTKSPTSLKVTLKQQQKGAELSYPECLKMELDMAMNFMQYDDFYEGVRAVLVDKDQSPKWNPASLKEVSDENIAAFFQYDWKKGDHPLQNMEDK